MTQADVFAGFPFFTSISEKKDLRKRVAQIFPLVPHLFGCHKVAFLSKEKQQTSSLSQRKGRAPQPSITFSFQGGGQLARGGGLHDNDDTDTTP